MDDELANSSAYFSEGTTSVEEIKSAKKENLKKTLEKEIDLSISIKKELYSREISYCKVVGYVKEQDK